MDDVFSADSLGMPYLPPSPAYPVDQLVAPTGAANAPAAAPVQPSATNSGQTGGIDWGRILGLLQPQQQSGFSVPGFMASLGAGLSSAGQNWNKPAAAAFAGGAGAALQGGQQFQQQQQDARIKALHTAIAAWKVGDLAAYHQAITDLRAASAPRPAAPSAPAAGAASLPSAAPGAATGGAAAVSSGAPAVANNAPAAAGAGAAPSFAGRSATDVLAQARDAIARGAPADKVLQRLADHGFINAGA